MNWAADFLERNPDLASKPSTRAKHGIHFAMSGRERIAVFTGKPCHYLENGIFKPIDTKLLPAASGFYGCPHSDVLIHPDGRVKVSGTDYQQYSELPGAPAGKLDGDKIIREFSGGRQILRVTETGFRQEIILEKIPDFKVIDAKKFLASIAGILPSKYKPGQLTAADTDAAAYAYTDTASLIAWLQAAKYPVIIDPDFTSTSPSGDTYLSGSTLRNYGITPTLSFNADPSVLMRFLLDSINSAADISAATLALTKTSATDTTRPRYYTIYEIADANGDWIEGTKNNATAGAGEPCWDYKAYNTVAWAGAAGCSTAGTDYINTALSDAVTLNRLDALETVYTWTFNAAGLAKLKSWFGDAANNGWLFKESGNNVNSNVSVGSAENETAGYRPLLTIAYTLPATGNPYYAYQQQ